MDKKSFRIKATPGGGDKVLNIKLEQSFDYLEILSLKISKDNFYKNFNSDYGVVVGRVIANDGLGIPNANVSLFIPLSDVDSADPKLSFLYPFKNITDKTTNFPQYNLLTPKPNYSVGSFPTKQQFLDDDTYVEMYDKYYKFSTKTNTAGDYMLFGVPVGYQTLHMDMDLSDIGQFSYTPNDMISNGLPESFFKKTSTDIYQFKESDELTSLPQVIFQNNGVDIKPLWGNKDENEIGITRFDFKVQISSNPIATFVVNVGIDQYVNKQGSFLGIKNNNKLRNYNGSNDGITNENNRPGEIDHIFPFVSSDGTTSYGEPYFKVKKYTADDANGFETTSVYIKSSKETLKEGIMILQLPCDQDKYITDEFGNLVKSDDVNKGIGTTGKYSIEIHLDAGMEIDMGEYWSFKFEKEGANTAHEPFVFQAKRIYSASMQLRKNRNLASKDYIIRKAPFQLLASVAPTQDQLSGAWLNPIAPYPTADMLNGDWLNCFLYFGRMGNKANDNNEQSIPTQLLYESDGDRFYDVETRFIDITDYFDLLADHTTYYLEVDLNDTKYWTADVQAQPTDIITASSNTQQGLPLKPRGSVDKRKVYFLATRKGKNNFKNFKGIIKR